MNAFLPLLLTIKIINQLTPLNWSDYDQTNFIIFSISTYRINFQFWKDQWRKKWCLGWSRAFTWKSGEWAHGDNWKTNVVGGCFVKTMDWINYFFFTENSSFLPLHPCYKWLDFIIILLNEKQLSFYYCLAVFFSPGLDQFLSQLFQWRPPRVKYNCCNSDKYTFIRSRGTR